MGYTARSKTPNHPCSGKRKWDCLYYLPPNCYFPSAKLKSKQQILTPGWVLFFTKTRFNSLVFFLNTYKKLLGSCGNTSGTSTAGRTVPDTNELPQALQRWLPLCLVLLHERTVD